MSTTHGMVGTTTYNSWRAMVDRCTQPTNNRWARYGGRGIKVCDRWRSFEVFFADMGERPAGCTIERNDSDGNYEPLNCRWATKREQANNQLGNVRVAAFGETKTVAEWSRDPRTCCNRKTLYWRIAHGVDPLSAVSVVRLSRRPHAYSSGRAAA